MKPVYWNDPDPRVRWGNPNLRWGSPSYLLEPGDEGYVELQPGQPGYVPPEPQPEPKRKRRRRSLSSSTSATTNQTTTAMNPFRYIVYLIKNLFTAKAVLRDAMTEGQFLDTLATRTGLTRAQIETVIDAMFTLFVELARQGIPIDFVRRKFRMLPSVGGRYQSPDPDNADVCDTLSFSLIVHPDEIDKVRFECPLEKVGEAGESGPEVESVRARPGNVVGKYGVGASAFTEVNGSGFRLSRADAEWCTAALVDQNGNNPIPLPVADCTPTRVVLGGAPAGTTGTYYLKLTAAYGDGTFTIYEQPLTNL